MLFTLCTGLLLGFAVAVCGNNCTETEFITCYEDHVQDVHNHQGFTIPLGESLNIFRRYGFLSYSVHIAPIQTNDTRLFKENTIPVLQRSGIEVQHNLRASMERHIQLYLCDSVDSLVSSFLQKFKVEGLGKPWKAFIASWRRHLLPRMLGIPAAYLTNDYRYLLVRIEKRSLVGTITGTAILNDALLEKIARVVPGNLRQAVDFFLDHGTHVIRSYISGDAVYQVLVYNDSNFQQLRTKLHDFDVNNTTRAVLTSMFATYPVHIGKLQLASGNRTFVQWLESRLAVSTLPKTLPSSIRLMAAPALLNHIYQQLDERAILGMELIAMTHAVLDPAKEAWLQDVLYNILRIWEMNL